MDYKKLLVKILIPNKRGIDNKKLNRILYNQNKYCNIFNFLLNEVYNDSISIPETLNRLKLHIDIKPLYPICHKPVNFIGKQSKMFSKYCSNSCRAKDPKNYIKWIEGQKKYNKENYGVEYNWQRKDIKELRKNKLIEHYGTDKLYKVQEIREKIDKSIKDKIHNIIENRNETLKEKYNIDNIGGLTSLPEIQEKINETKKKNNSFNKSNPEEQTYIILKTKYPDTQRQYRSEVYPFNCDFYIPSLDLYIECNYHWTHGGKLFENSEEDNIKLEKWKSKNTRFYNNAIKTWTIRDIEKRNVANENKLNYLVFYNFDNFNNWITNQPLSIYKDEELFKYEYENYLNKEGNLNSYFKTSYIIKYFQQDIFYKKENELWNNQEIKNKLIENRRKYLNKELITDIEYLNGFKRSFIYYGYSHFNPLWFKWFIKEYNCKICYDPCGGWGHRLLGSNLLEKYIYNDINKEIFNNVNRIIEYFNIKNTICYNNDCNEFIPNENFDSMFTFPPYYNIENYNKEN